jgi:hypothetical protein
MLFGIWYDKFIFCITSFIYLAGRWQVIYIFFSCAGVLWKVLLKNYDLLWKVYLNVYD